MTYLKRNKYQTQLAPYVVMFLCEFLSVKKTKQKKKREKNMQKRLCTAVFIEQKNHKEF